ncbi:GGDEF domain-containing protein [Candidatus Colwellia aromaticivorans]|uniref:GGDEF domain-containing protein n=1 Tax=Candidatus Colwellia aromaticivorans TaxID=2267621 RepID=UPI000DF38F36|nr:GGDEF domain-containing protein [Candidatus Colwellia aromaticivorans]
MNTKTVAVSQMQALKDKLNAAIESRASLEEDFGHQSNLLIQFINKLSLVSKGINLELDNRLAQLRVLLTKSSPISDIEFKIAEISKLLQRHTVTNEQNITHLHNQFNNAGQILQKTNGLPDDLRRQLRTLLEETQSTKESITQYVPLLNKLIELYDIALRSKVDIPKGRLLAATQSLIDKTQSTNNNSFEINTELVEQIAVCLSKLHLSAQHTKKLLALNTKLINDTKSDDILQHFIEIFDVIVADYQNERKSAKNFLNTLNVTLSNVQASVKETLSTCNDSQSTNNKINDKLQNQLLELSTKVEAAMSLEHVKVDINVKLKSLAGTLQIKEKFEQQSQQALASQLDNMSKKVKHLEEQRQGFAKKLAEEQRKSMQDSLTKLSNRAAFDEYFTKAMVRFHHKPFDLAIVVIDIDDFKHINDTYGHTAGDKTLQVIATTIAKKVSDDVFVARYGGEEFVLIYSSKKEIALTHELNLINKHIARLPFKFKSNKVSITLSMGFTHITNNDNIHTAFERADQAMYKAKKQGKNQVIYLK